MTNTPGCTWFLRNIKHQKFCGVTETKTCLRIQTLALTMVRWKQSTLSVNVFSTKLVEDALIFTLPTKEGTTTLRGHQSGRPSRFSATGLKTHWSGPAGNRTHDIPLCKHVLYRQNSSCRGNGGVGVMNFLYGMCPSKKKGFVKQTLYCPEIFTIA